jgi:hypothetical protein
LRAEPEQADNLGREPFKGFCMTPLVSWTSIDKQTRFRAPGLIEEHI